MVKVRYTGGLAAVETPAGPARKGDEVEVEAWQAEGLIANGDFELVEGEQLPEVIEQPAAEPAPKKKG